MESFLASGGRPLHVQRAAHNKCGAQYTLIPFVTSRIRRRVTLHEVTTGDGLYIVEVGQDFDTSVSFLGLWERERRLITLGYGTRESGFGA
mmetsp:Transcript_2918/g.18331  ORF Transcript_2918/g.18331 Transcript_2918/m.18331 type:complete len:91 (+) Transcript_2918:1087-1359(+)